MPDALANGITIHHDTFGDPRHPALLLVMGLGTQMTGWRPELCRALAAHGLFVIRFDNRDIGLSTKLHGAPVPSIPRLLALRPLGLARAPYVLSDMARDAVGLLDALGVRSAHVAGVSMGGMIAQTLAIEHPTRVRSLVSIMSSPGDAQLPLPTRAARAVLLRPPPRTRDEAIDRFVDVYRTIGSPRFFDERVARTRGAESYDRSRYRLGAGRQLAAILASPSRSRALRALRIPATVVHGVLDPLVPIEHGRATARAIPHAELRVLEEMAHDLPEPL